jgi:hypothetical protein
MSDDLDAPPRGRLFVVTGSPGGSRVDVARALAERLGECVVVDGEAIEAMVTARPPEPPGGRERLRRQLLRWSACLAVAETYQLPAARRPVSVAQEPEPFVLGLAHRGDLLELVEEPVVDAREVEAGLALPSLRQLR